YSDHLNCPGTLRVASGPNFPTRGARMNFQKVWRFGLVVFALVATPFALSHASATPADGGAPSPWLHVALADGGAPSPWLHATLADGGAPSPWLHATFADGGAPSPWLHATLADGGAPSPW